MEKKTVRGKKVQVKCKNECCGNIKEVRQSDIKRGWGMFCSKHCKAVFQEKMKKEIKLISEVKHEEM